jgi:TatD DNase family protein
MKGSEQKVQEDVFEEHIRLSEKYSCPLTIHCVRKYSEILSFRKNSQAKQPWILHGFNSSLQMMEQMVDSGIYISLGVDLLKDSEKIIEVCRLAPTGSLFLETDDSGYEIDQIYQKAAEIRELTVEGIKDILDDNFRRVFYLCNLII